MMTRSIIQLGLLLSVTFGILTVSGLSPSSVAAPPALTGASWLMLGGTNHRNQSDPITKGLPADWSVKKGKEKNLKWAAQLGTMAYGGPVISGGKIFIGTNNDRPRDPNVKGDKGILMCFNEADGQFLWQIVHEKLDNADDNDCPKHGVASVPVVEGDRLYYVSNRCAMVCASTEGKVLWEYDMIKELGVYPCYLANSSPLVVGDLVFAVTANGVSPADHKLPAPKAASFVAINTKKGKLAWKDDSPGMNIMEGQWTSPAAVEVDGQTQVIVPGGDGWIRSFEAQTGKLVWKFDGNPKKAKPYMPGGRGEKSYFVAVPVIYEGKVYIATGQNPDDGPGVGNLYCIDPAKKPANKDLDLSPVDDNFDPKAEVNKNSGLVWYYGGYVMPKPANGEKETIFGRTVSTVAIHDGLLYAAEGSGYLHCLDAKTGKKYWEYDLRDSTWSSPFYIDGRVLMGVDSGDLYIFEAGKDLKEPKKIDMEQPLKVPPIAANGVLYINNGMFLYAIASK